MAKKPESHQHDWDAHVSREKKRNKQLQIAMISILSVAALATVYLGVVIVFEDSPDIPDDEAAAAAGALNPDRPTSGTEPDGEDPKPKPEPVAPGTSGEGDPLAGTPDSADKKEEAPTVSPLFEDRVVEDGLQAIDLGEERNFLVLLNRYSSEIADEPSREALQKIYLFLKDGKPAEALEESAKLKVTAWVRDGVRAVILTRLLKKKEASDAFSRADSKAQPAEFNFEYGIYYLGAGNLKLAFEQFAAGTRKSPGSAQLQFAAAGAAYDLKKWDDVVKHVDRGTKVTETVPPKLSLLAAASEVRLGKREDAIARCQSVLKSDPDSHTTKLFLARVLASTGELDGALSFYTELEKEMPDAPLIKVELVKALMANDNKDEAVEVARKFSVSKPDDLRIQAWYANVLAANEKFEEAAKILEGLSDDLTGDEMAVLQSIIALRRNDFEAAAKALEPYHKADPNLAIRWASFKFRQGQTGADIQQVLEAHQLTAIQWKIVATNAVALSHWEMASFAYDRSIAQGDQTVDTLNNSAWCAIQNPGGFDAEKVERTCERALKAAPENPNILHTYAQALFKSDQIGRCAELFVKYSDVSEKSAELSLLRGQVYLSLGVKPSALEAFEHTLELMKEASAWNLELTKEKIEEMIAELQG